MNILITWIGTQDLNAARDQANAGTGPIANALTHTPFDKAVILGNWGSEALSRYIDWLRPQTKALLDGKVVELKNPTDFRGIYQIANETIASVLDMHEEDDPELTYHVSPGTSQMAMVWTLLMTRYPARLIQSSVEAGTEVIDIPFEISAEYIAKGLAPADEALARVSALLSGGAIGSIDYQSEPMKRLLNKVVKAAHRWIPVYIEGEPGTEKLQLARTLHDGGNRASESFIHLDCAAYEESELESQLFGDDDRSFGGAYDSAAGGTLYLESMELLPPILQARLLLALDAATQESPRMVISSRVNLLSEVTEGRFREDLFYALAVVLLKIPSLRDRTGDLGRIIEHTLRRINEESSSEPGFEPRTLSPAAKNFLIQERWPGNMHELQNTLRRAVVWSDGAQISENEVWDSSFNTTSRANVNDPVLGLPLEQGVDIQKVVAEVVMHYIDRVKDYTGGNKSQSANLLGLSSYQTLENWDKKYKKMLRSRSNSEDATSK
jgi:DNA-binding NtrC family response regulator